MTRHLTLEAGAIAEQASDHAIHLGHPYLGGEHFLLAVAASGTGENAGTIAGWPAVFQRPGGAEPPGVVLIEESKPRRGPEREHMVAALEDTAPVLAGLLDPADKEHRLFRLPRVRPGEVIGAGGSRARAASTCPRSAVRLHAHHPTSRRQPGFPELRGGGGPAQNAQERVLAYLDWASNAVRMLGGQISSSDRPPLTSPAILPLAR